MSPGPPVHIAGMCLAPQVWPAPLEPPGPPGRGADAGGDSAGRERRGRERGTGGQQCPKAPFHTRLSVSVFGLRAVQSECLLCLH